MSRVVAPEDIETSFQADVAKARKVLEGELESDSVLPSVLIARLHGQGHRAAVVREAIWTLLDSDDFILTDDRHVARGP